MHAFRVHATQDKLSRTFGLPRIFVNTDPERQSSSHAMLLRNMCTYDYLQNKKTIPNAAHISKLLYLWCASAHFIYRTQKPGKTVII